MSKFCYVFVTLLFLVVDAFLPSPVSLAFPAPPSPIFKAFCCLKNAFYAIMSREETISININQHAYSGERIFIKTSSPTGALK